MEGRTRRNTKAPLRGASGPARRSGSRGRDLLSPISSAAMTQVDTRETGGTSTSKNALRERTRVESLRRAYLELQSAIPSVPPNTKLSKLDVLVLATTYISHLSQLLQEDDLRATHDTNNNTTTSAATTVTVKPGGHDQHSHYPKTDPASRGPQKGFLHPVKKWPMRARLYPGVGVTQAAALLMEQPATPRHLRSKLGHLPAHSPTYPLAAHLSTPTFQHTHAVDFGSSSGATGMPTEEVAASDVGAETTFLCGLSASHHCLPPSTHPPHYVGAWEAEGAWGSDATYSDLTSCHQPCTSYTGCWSSWHD